MLGDAHNVGEVSIRTHSPSKHARGRNPTQQLYDFTTPNLGFAHRSPTTLKLSQSLDIAGEALMITNAHMAAHINVGEELSTRM